MIRNFRSVLKARPSESAVMARAGITGDRTWRGIKKWRSANGPQPPRTDSKAFEVRAAGSFFRAASKFLQGR